ncbi:hypothetical protein EYF80_010762 [Liparis tanakae]|uniref:Uncharacterized protein n=1 Tax=Liparis tanakae TaxID=230148 RepID=A0A4Z2IPI0_9TELE|nr:hypothetical protein EYF80_010762 [Liparis tanakae]
MFFSPSLHIITKMIVTGQAGQREGGGGRPTLLLQRQSSQVKGTRLRDGRGEEELSQVEERVSGQTVWHLLLSALFSCMDFLSTLSVSLLSTGGADTPTGPTRAARKMPTSAKCEEVVLEERAAHPPPSGCSSYRKCRFSTGDVKSSITASNSHSTSSRSSSWTNLAATRERRAHTHSSLYS